MKLAHIVAGISTAAAIATSATSCTSPPSTPNPATPITSTPVTNGHTACEPHYVCGTCPNGDTWSYLNDGSPGAQWAKQSNTIFDVRHPCDHNPSGGQGG